MVKAEKVSEIGLRKEFLGMGKTVLVLGASGMVGSRFVEIFGGANFITPESSELNILDRESVKRFVKEYQLDFIVNFAAYTNVDKAQGEGAEECLRINLGGIANVLEAIDSKKTHFIQISTDMGFTGRKNKPGPYKEVDESERDPAKVTWYGYTKAEAERLIKDVLGEGATIVRIIYPVRTGYDKKLDYLRGALAKYTQGELKPLFTDQQISLTDIDDLCYALKIIIEKDLHGVFHVGSCDTSTPHKVISKFISLIEGRKVDLASRLMGDLTDRYPQYGGLDVAKTQEVLGIKFKTINQILYKIASEFI